ncbi:hypothetical protein ACXIUS_29725 [Bosea thiooxidans]
MRYQEAVMHEIKDARVTILAAPSDLSALDGWRRNQPDIPNRSEAIRRLIHLGIKAEPILRDLLRLLERLQWDDEAAELDKHIADIKEALGL